MKYEVTLTDNLGNLLATETVESKHDANAIATVWHMDYSHWGYAIKVFRIAEGKIERIF